MKRQEPTFDVLVIRSDARYVLAEIKTHTGVVRVRVSRGSLNLPASESVA